MSNTISICEKHIIRCQYMSLRCILKWFNTFISHLQRKKLRRVARFPKPPSLCLPEAWGLWPETAPLPPLAPERGRPLLLCPDSCGSVSWRTSLRLGGSLPWKFLYFFCWVCLKWRIWPPMSLLLAKNQEVKTPRKLWKHHGNSAIIGDTFCDFEPLETQTLFLILRLKKPSCIYIFHLPTLKIFASPWWITRIPWGSRTSKESSKSSSSEASCSGRVCVDYPVVRRVPIFFWGVDVHVKDMYIYIYNYIYILSLVQKKIHEMCIYIYIFYICIYSIVKIYKYEWDSFPPLSLLCKGRTCLFSIFDILFTTMIYCSILLQNAGCSQ